jgi:putative glutamine amidotransferase
MVKDRLYRPLIGINADVKLSGKSKTAFSVSHSLHYDCILTAGGLPIVIPPLTRPEELAPILDRLDGVLLTEGEDLDPLKMGLGPHPAIKKCPERRETADRLLCKMVQQRKMPLLGIGLGMQEINVFFGGGIYQHLPEDMPRCIPHFDPQGGVHRHIVTMEKGSMFEDIYGEGEIRVTSYHHQGVRKLAPGFRAGALAPDGLIEAIEWAGEDWFCAGVQWHPHKDGTVSLDTQLLEAFVNAAAKMKPSEEKIKPSLALAS